MKKKEAHSHEQASHFNLQAMLMYLAIKSYILLYKHDSFTMQSW